jgi:hypothetical protein
MDIEERYRRAFPEQYELFPEQKNKWRYIPLVIIAVCLALIALPALAQPKFVKSTILCDTQEQIVDILSASAKSGAFEDSIFKLHQYVAQKNDQNEPTCLPLSAPAPFVIHNSFIKVMSVNPLGEPTEYYVLKVDYPGAGVVATGYIAVTEDALYLLLGEEPKDKTTY